MCVQFSIRTIEDCVQDASGDGEVGWWDISAESFGDVGDRSPNAAVEIVFPVPRVRSCADR